MQMPYGINVQRNVFGQEALSGYESSRQLLGLSFPLQSKLLDAWGERHQLRELCAPSIFPAKPPEELAPTLCSKLHVCVCSGMGQQAHYLHMRLVSLIKPFIISKKGKGSESKKKAKTPQRRLLDNVHLILKLDPISPEVDPFSDQPPVPLSQLSSWGLAALGISNPQNFQTLWLHIGYMNMQSHEFSGLRLEAVRTFEESGKILTQLRACDEPEILSSREMFAARLELLSRVPLVAEWFQIVADDRELSHEEFCADTIFVSALENSGEHHMPRMLVWRGPQKEEHCRKEEQRRRRQKSSRTSRRDPNDPNVAGSLPPGLPAGIPQLEDGMFDNGEMEEEDAGGSDSDADREEDGKNADMDGVEELFSWALEASKAIADRDKDKADAKKKNQKNLRKGDPEKTPVRTADSEGPSSASSSSALPVPPVPAVAEPVVLEPASPRAPAPPTPEAPAPPPAPEVGRIPALGRKKEVTEQVLALPGFGDIRYNPKSKVLVAHCACEKHGDCRRQRTCVGSSKSLLGPGSLGQGRPLGLLVAWLLEQKDFGNRRDHVSKSLVHLRRQKRVDAREFLKTIPGVLARFNFIDRVFLLRIWIRLFLTFFSFHIKDFLVHCDFEIALLMLEHSYRYYRLLSSRMPCLSVSQAIICASF